MRMMSGYIKTKEIYDVSPMFTHGEDPDMIRVNGNEFVKVVRCKDCKWWEEPWSDPYGIYGASCKKAGYMCSGDDYCSSAVRKDTDEQEEREIINARRGEE